jgi:hypothetical protein
MPRTMRPPYGRTTAVPGSHPGPAAAGREAQAAGDSVAGTAVAAAVLTLTLSAVAIGRPALLPPARQYAAPRPMGFNAFGRWEPLPRCGLLAGPNGGPDGKAIAL